MVLIADGFGCADEVRNESAKFTSHDFSREIICLTLCYRILFSPLIVALLPSPNNAIMTTDNLYTTSLAHRSIARAALHLGIEGMETKALEALGGVLVDYLEKVRLFFVLYFVVVTICWIPLILIIVSYCYI